MVANLLWKWLNLISRGGSRNCSRASHASGEYRGIGSCFQESSEFFFFFLTSYITEDGCY